jgi:hypothetical protein
MKAEGSIPVDSNGDIPSAEVTFGDLASCYLTNKVFRKISTKDLHTQIVNEILKPRWADKVAVAIKPKQIKDWLYTIVVEDTTRHKYKRRDGRGVQVRSIGRFAPLGDQFNPVSYVTGIPSVSDYEAIALTPEQALKVLEHSTTGIHNDRIGCRNGYSGERDAGSALV